MKLLSLPLELSMLLALALALSIGHRPPSTRGRRTLVLMCLGVFSVALGEWLTLRGFVAEGVGDRIKYLGSLTLAPLWLGFAAQVTGVEVARRVPWFPALLLTPALFVYPLLYSTAYMGLFHVTVVGADDLRGPLWFIVTIYHQALCTMACAILASSAVRMRDPRRSLRALLLAFVPMAAIVAGTLHRAGAIAWPYDAHPVLLGVGLLLMRDALLGGGLLDTLPFPQRELLRQLPLGLVLTDRGGVVAMINGAGARALGVAPDDALGRDVEDLLAEAPAASLEQQAFERGGRPAGRLLVFDEARVSPAS